MASLHEFSPESCLSTQRKETKSVSDVKYVPLFLMIQHVYTENTKKIAHFTFKRHLTSASRFHGLLLVEMKSDTQCKKLLKQELLGSFPLFVEKHESFISTRCTPDSQTTHIRNIPCLQEIGKEINTNMNCTCNFRIPNDA
jgi:hypothetical protein